MKHECQQIRNLLRRTAVYSLNDLGITSVRGSVTTEQLLSHIEQRLPRALLNVSRGTVFRIKELVNRQSNIHLLCIAGTLKTGNAVLLVSEKRLRQEELMYDAHPNTVRLCNFVSISNTTNKILSGRLGTVYGTYHKRFLHHVTWKEFDELEHISYVDDLHEFMLTGVIPNLTVKEG